MTTRTVITGGRVARRSGDRYASEPADIVVGGSRIEEIEQPGRVTPGPGDTVIDASGKLVLPGLVNAHTHSYANLARGRFDGLPLEPWVAHVAAVTARRTWREGYVAALVGCVEAAKTGTTALLDQLGGTVDSLRGALQAYRDFGMRAVLAPMIADLPPHETVVADGPVPAALRRQLDAVDVPPTAEVLGGLRDLIDEQRSGDGATAVFPGPSGPQRCSPELFAACGDLADRHDTGLHTHLLETRAQQRFAGERYGRSMVTYLADLGVLSRRFSGAHGVWCTPEDLGVLAASHATLVHNPWSNLTLGSGVADVRSWARAGVTVALGTDGANCGGSLSMFRAMNLAVCLQRDAADPVEEWTTPHEVLRWATEGSAAALQLDGGIGRLEPGCPADLVLVDVDAPTYVPPHDLVAQAVLGETGANVHTTMVAGRTVVEDGRCVTVDEAALVAEARDLAHGVLTRNADLLANAESQRSWLLAASRDAHAPGS